MLRILSVLSLFSISAHATHLDTVCKSALNHPPVFAEGVVAHRVNLATGQPYVLDTFEGTRIFNHTSEILSVIVVTSKIFFLTKNELIQLKKEDGSVTAKIDFPNGVKMTLAGNLLLIVTNRGVIRALNVNTLVEEWSTRVEEISDGRAIGIAFDGQDAQIIMTSTEQGGFNGIATLNLSNGKVIRKTAYDNARAGVIDPEASGKWHNQELVLNNGGWIHVITAMQLLKGKTIKPRWVAHPVGSGTTLHYMMLKGEFFFEDKNLVGCGFYNERQNDEWVDLTKLFKVALP